MQVAWLTVQWCEEIPKASGREVLRLIVARLELCWRRSGGWRRFEKSNHPARVCQDHKSKYERFPVHASYRARLTVRRTLVPPDHRIIQPIQPTDKVRADPGAEPTDGPYTRPLLSSPRQLEENKACSIGTSKKLVLSISRGLLTPVFLRAAALAFVGFSAAIRGGFRAIGTHT